MALNSTQSVLHLCACSARRLFATTQQPNSPTTHASSSILKLQPGERTTRPRQHRPQCANTRLPHAPPVQRPRLLLAETNECQVSGTDRCIMHRKRVKIPCIPPRTHPNDDTQSDTSAKCTRPQNHPRQTAHRMPLHGLPPGARNTTKVK